MCQRLFSLLEVVCTYLLLTQNHELNGLIKLYSFVFNAEIPAETAYF